MRCHNRWIGLVVALLLSGCALQDDVYTLDHRLTALERHNVELARQNQALEKRNQELLQAKETIATRVEGLDETRRNEEIELRGQYAEMAAQLQAMRDANQLVSGRLDEMEYLLNQKLNGFEANQEKIDARMDRLATDVAGLQKKLGQTKRAASTTVSKPAVSKPAAATAAPRPEPAVVASDADKTLYDATKAAFDGGDMQAAREGFEKLIAEFPDSRYADNAQYFIGETYYREKWYEKAILEYQKVIENFPDGNKVAAALLKQGLAFINIGERNNARLILKDLATRFPGTQEAKTAQQKLDTL